MILEIIYNNWLVILLFGLSGFLIGGFKIDKKIIKVLRGLKNCN